MYRPVLSARDRAATVIAVVAIHLGLAYALLNMTGAIELPDRDELTRLIDISPEPPPPPIVEVQVEKAKPKKEEGAASAKNIESKATPVVAPKPRVEVPSPQPIIASPTPNQGTDPTQGASDVVGPGTGAGGSGTGTGSGGSGSGPGGGGAGEGTRPALISPTLTRRDYPDSVQRRWPRGGAVFVAVRIQLDGRATDCRIDRSSGDRAIDEWTCSLVQTRLRFRPATDDRGRLFVSWYGYIQRDTGRMN